MKKYTIVYKYGYGSEVEAESYEELKKIVVQKANGYHEAVEIFHNGDRIVQIKERDFEKPENNGEILSEYGRLGGFMSWIEL